MRQRLICFIEKLVSEETYEEETGVLLFSDGSDCATCTNSARRIARKFGGEVFGYWTKDNASAELGMPLCEGHDFAIVGRRWIADYWAFHVARVIEFPIFDLGSSGDRQAVSRLYGNSETWEALAV